MADVEPGEISDQASPTPPRLDRVGLSEGRDTTRFSNGAEGPRENVTFFLNMKGTWVGHSNHFRKNCDDF